MNLRDFGKLHTTEQGRFWMLEAMYSLKSSIVDAELNRVQPFDAMAETTGNHIINNARGAFRILEIYLLDAEWAVENTISTYWNARNGKTTSERWELFVYTVNTTEWGFLFDLYNDSRPKEILDTVSTEDEKKEPLSA